ncbi:alpha/beta hydrolase domain-containing protein [Rhodopirellula sp. P2]|uniref:alpha/beta hydrolase domain-containing protein n=1 Tax=Rhodopirellula sp. P2 TaxID=2127060 RepID=UPI002367F814|nr:alpha/beta hydrolase domain-containing protein [Rhodopirellula sp. P2]WDQ14961.1 alpha/beta hydrolase domain-containing protein [Rhodopirellula sp. P2]
MKCFHLVIVFFCLCLSSVVMADVTRVEITQRQPFADSFLFGPTGAYETISGRMHFEVDPNAQANSRVCDLKLAPRNANGRVEFWEDFFLLRPADPNKGNGCLLYDVHNRGSKLALWTFNDAEMSGSPSTMAHAGNGFLMRQGYSVLWTGWNGDVMADGTGRLLAGLPVATNPDGSPITGKNHVEILVDEPKFSQPFYFSPWGTSAAYPTIDLNDPAAKLTRRESRSSQPIVVPRDEWAFADFEDGKVTPNPTSLHVQAGFQPGWIYELVYTARDPRVSGLGMAGIRDAVSFLRYDDNAKDSSGQSLSADCDRAIIFGISQSGRLAHHFMYEGMNVDLNGRTVFDGALIHVAGAGKGMFNHRFGMATVYGTQLQQNLSPSDFFPFTTTQQNDPVTGGQGDSLARLRNTEGLPKLFFVQSSTEYWSRAASLLHTDVDGTRDIDLDENTRIYLISGAQHLGATSTDPGICRYMRNPLKHRGPVLRALLTAMDEWVTNDTEPPASEYPRISDGTLVSVEAFRKQFPQIAGVELPMSCYQPLRLNPGARWATDGIADNVPPLIGKPYRTLVPAVDVDGNELAGIRLPDVAVPTATYMGWNLRNEASGAKDSLAALHGGYLPLPASRQNDDSRQPLDERYRTRAEYLANHSAATIKLWRERFLLAEDAISLLNEAGTRDLSGEPASEATAR